MNVQKIIMRWKEVTSVIIIHPTYRNFFSSLWFWFQSGTCSDAWKVLSLRNRDIIKWESQTMLSWTREYQSSLPAGVLTHVTQEYVASQSWKYRKTIGHSYWTRWPENFHDSWTYAPNFTYTNRPQNYIYITEYRQL